MKNFNLLKHIDYLLMIVLLPQNCILHIAYCMQ